MSVHVVARVRVCAVAAAVSLMSPAARAQDEPALKSFFEGRPVMLRMDMPGSADGVDLHFDETHPMDVDHYQRDLKRYGVAIHAGDLSVITLIKVKKDLIEFHLGGGGFGTFGDDTSTSANIKLLEKSDKEKALEKQVKDEKDPAFKKKLEKQLDEVRDDRERENRRLTYEKERIEEEKRQRIAQQRLSGGSRFNLRYANRVPPRTTPESLIESLAEYVDFNPQRSAPAATPAMAPGFASRDFGVLRKGMLRSEAERAFGRAVERRERRDGGVNIVTLVFETPDHRIAADFAEDVLIRYTISSK
jgi:hypothetical protein